MLIDTRQPPSPSESELPAWEPNWRLWGWIALTVAAAAGMFAAPPIVAYLLLLVVVVCACEAFCAGFGYLEGLREHRQ